MPPEFQFFPILRVCQVFLSFIGPKCDHCLPLPLTDKPADCLADLTDATLAFEDANSKLYYAVSTAEVDFEERVVNSLIEILKLRFGENLKYNFGQHFKAGIWSRS